MQYGNAQVGAAATRVGNIKWRCKSAVAAGHQWPGRAAWCCAPLFYFFVASSGTTTPFWLPTQWAFPWELGYIVQWVHAWDAPYCQGATHRQCGFHISCRCKFCLYLSFEGLCIDFDFIYQIYWFDKALAICATLNSVCLAVNDQVKKISILFFYHLGFYIMKWQETRWL